jgi:iron(III) transport system permease protein
VTLWVTPGPLLGVGLKEAIDLIMAAEEAVLGTLNGPLKSVLYLEPSPLPGLWANTLRFFPVAVALLWPAVRAVPQQLRDAARVDGAGPFAELRLVVWPVTRDAAFRTACAVGLLALGEISASKLVEPPGRQTYVQELFNQMHYGVETPLAAMCLVQVGITAAVVFAWFNLPKLFDRRA